MSRLVNFDSMNIALVDDHQILLQSLQREIASMEGVEDVQTFTSPLHFLDI